MMVEPASIVEQHLRRREALTGRVSVRAVRLFRSIDPQFLDAGWDRVAPALVALVSAGQVTAARQSAPYMNQVVAVSGGAPAASVVPEAFSGVDIEGREIGPAMFGSVTTTKTLIGRGVPVQRAFEAGAAFLATLVGAAIQDMGRQSDITLATGRGFTHYVRVLSAGACSRCAILAGTYSAKTAYPRHPRCKCSAWPVVEGERAPDGVFADTMEYFDSLSPAEQDRVFTRSGAWAIREGADPIAVVNARRGARGIGYSGHHNAPRVAMGRLQPVTIGVKADGSPLQVFATSEGTTVRGSFGRAEIGRTGDALKEGRYRRTTRLRLMPEQIQVMGDGNPARTQELLRRYGYLR